jgi:hypothetical protein
MSPIPSTIFKPFILFRLKGPRYKTTKKLIIIIIFIKRRTLNLSIKTDPLAA